jgi:hypothetical protein
MSDFDYLRGRTGLSLNIELVASCLSYQRHKFCVNRSFITPDIVKNLRRGQTVTIQKRTVTVGQ